MNKFQEKLDEVFMIVSGAVFVGFIIYLQIQVWKTMYGWLF
jgi:hypothetical protein